MDIVIISVVYCKFTLILSGNPLTNINLTVVFSPSLLNPASLISLAKHQLAVLFIYPNNLAKAEKAHLKRPPLA